MLTSRALDGLGAIDGITIYGPRDAARLPLRIQGFSWCIANGGAVTLESTGGRTMS